MTTVAQLAKQMQDVLVDQANELAWQTGFMERERILTGSSFVVGLVSAWQANPNVSLAGLSQAVANAGTSITRQGLNDRFTPKAVKFMREMAQASIKALVQGVPRSEGLMSRFTSVDVVDSTIVTLPNSLSKVWYGSGGNGEQASMAALKLSVRWDVGGGQISYLDFSDGIQHDRHAAAHQASVMEKSLQIRDLGYFKLADLEAIAQQGAYWLIKYKIGTHLLAPDGEVIDLTRWLPQRVGQRLDTEVIVGKKQQMTARLVAERVPKSVVEQRHERILETARQNQQAPSERALALAHWTIFLTNVPLALLKPAEVLIMARFRWQIELLFKLWKSDLQIDEWCTKNPNRILCELYAKLIAAIVTHWFMLLACWDNPRRSLRQAMPTIRGLAWQWANSLMSRRLLSHMLQSLIRALSFCSLEPSRMYPRSYQLEELSYA